MLFVMPEKVYNIMMAVSLLSTTCCISHDFDNQMLWSNSVVWGLSNSSSQAGWSTTTVNSSVGPYLVDELYSNLLEWSEAGTNLSACQTSLIKFASDLVNGKSYTRKVIDSTGKLESGVLMGNYRWLGRYYECLDTRNEHFHGKWCSLIFGEISSFNGNPSGLTIGFCIPDTCTEENVKIFLSHMYGTKQTRNMFVNCPMQPTQWKAADLTFLFLLSVFVILLIVGTLTEIHAKHHCATRGDALIESRDELNDSSSFGAIGANGWRKVLLSFSIIRNTKMLLNVDRKPGTIKCLDGIRFVSVTWVVLGHTFSNFTDVVDNVSDMYIYMINHITTLVITNAFMAVDTFFFMSGFLISYLSLMDDDRLTVKRLPKFYLQRYVRITPAYAFIILFMIGFHGKIGSGPLWPDTFDKDDGGCAKYWWTNLLYIDNLHPANVLKKCFVAGWYLSNDMQFFVLAPISILILKRNKRLGLTLLIFGLFSSMLVTGVISSHYDSQPLPVVTSLLYKTLNLSTTNAQQSLHHPPPMNAVDEFWSELYVRPWCRIGVYLIGMMTGYILVVTKCVIHMKKIYVTLGWGVATAFNSLAVYGTWWYVKNAVKMEANLAALYNAVHRPMWACGVAWVVIACSTGNGGPINTFLSWKALVPFSRLTFCIYLVNPPIFDTWYGSLEVVYHYNMVSMPIYFLGVLTLSVGFAYALSMLVETPFVNLLRLWSESAKDNAQKCIALPENCEGTVRTDKAQDA